MTPIRTWLDIERVFKEKTFNYSELPETITRIDCFYDAIEIAVIDESSKNPVKQLLKEWFEKWFDEINNAFYSEINPEINTSIIPVEFTIEEAVTHNAELFARPFFKDLEYLKGSEQDERITQQLFPKSDFEGAKIIAFHSFKGGVSRTTHLAGYLFELIQHSKNILVIDADIEAPGLSYWNDKEGLLPNVSLVDYLEAYNYPPTDLDDTIEFYAKELKKSPNPLGFYFLPAFLNEEQLLSMQVFPQHIAKNINNRWEYSEAIYKLATALGAEFVLIDLRAGLTELSSPILFDPRVERYLVSTVSEQSIRGTQLILKKLAHFSPSLEQVKEEKYTDPKVIISMVKTDFRGQSKVTVLDDAREKLLEAYSLNDGFEDIQRTRLQIEETDYHDELAFISTWRDARNKLEKASSISSWAVHVVKQVLPIKSTSLDNRITEVKKLKDICEQYEFAEQGKNDDLLITQSLRHLAENHIEKLPQVVCIGAKGAGKTFNYIQLSRFKKWSVFLKKLDILPAEKKDPDIYPVLQAQYGKDEAQNIINQAREIDNINLDLSHIKNEISKFISQKIVDELEWRKFWVNLINSLLTESHFDSSHLKENLKFSIINKVLAEKNTRIIFLFDGLEEIFSDISKNESQKIAVKSLIQLPNEMSAELMDANFGMIIFLRRDFLRYAITQNTAQFEKLYAKYDLYWDKTSYLQLVYWICAQASIIGLSKDTNINELSQHDIEQALKKLWGEKLGGERQPYTINWVYAALTDFKARIQARDIIRLLRYSAEETLKTPISSPSQAERWSDRLLFPEAIRKSLNSCSKDKITEMQEEYPLLKNWAKTLSQLRSEQRKIPFTLDQINSDKDTINMLIDIGAVYEDADKNGIERYYIPEIFRAGLGFSYANSAKPRILMLMRKITGK
ncbi:MAG: ParA family protein [Methyloprofundus sp.]|nr:ParA family protein [Methyloprofundus sp.]